MAMVMTVAAVASAEVTSGPQVGEMVGAFTVTKVAGNAEDGVTDGKTLCYRCKMGSRPVVMVFARSADEKLAKFVKELEEEIEEHQDAKLTAFVNMIGTDEEALKKAAADFVAKHGITRVAFVVPTQAKDGPENLKIAPDADLTVVCYKEGTVKANHAFSAGSLSDEKIDAIVHASCEMAE
ncbi:MAG: hypothetical protein DWI04_02385 [Planctomycetota bacterium]|jgi:hypothetical protein|nr:MAG: hypothetical protein DWI04_02385 [Planctomycetota bacterium]